MFPQEGYYSWNGPVQDLEKLLSGPEKILENSWNVSTVNSIISAVNVKVYKTCQKHLSCFIKYIQLSKSHVFKIVQTYKR